MGLAPGQLRNVRWTEHGIRRLKGIVNSARDYMGHDTQRSFYRECGIGTTAGRHGLAPDFSLPDVYGKRWSWSQFRGKRVLLYMWASW